MYICEHFDKFAETIAILQLKKMRRISEKYAVNRYVDFTTIDE